MIGRAWLNGRLRYLPGEGGTGESIGYFDNGAVWFRCPVLNGHAHGTVRIWFSDGTLAEEADFQNGISHGAARTWYRNGVVEKEENYNRGKLHGAWKVWYPSDPGVQRPKIQCTYVDDLLHGPLTAWHQNGNLRIEAHYDHGRNHGVHKFYNEDGTFDGKAIYVRGVKMPVKKYEQFLAGKLPAKDILAIRNSAVRRILVEEFGYARILAQMPHEVIDREGEQELVRINWSVREEPICLVKVKCPSTGAFYTLRVPPERITVKSAVAWTFDVKADDYQPVKET